ncbi:MAG: SulP family inorganic anion transporter [Acidimicrobiia bacterium]
MNVRPPRGLLPGRDDYAGLRRSWRADLQAGLTVAVVALPLALAFGITAGMDAQAGLVTAVVAGIVAAVFGGSHVQVSGPTGAMTVVLVPIVARYGQDAVLTVGLVAGALVVAASLLRAGRFLAYVPWPVMEGFTAGIAVVIFLQQVPAALGVQKPAGENTLAVAVRSLWQLPDQGHLATVGLVVATIAVMTVTPRIRRTLPASLLAVVVATVVAEVADLDVARIGALPASLPSPDLPGLSIARISDLLGAAVAVASLAAIESLLSAKVADGMSDVRRHDSDRELFGQGLANLVSPLFGGMPATGAIARTAVNVRAGARTRVAAGSHAVVILAVVLFASTAVARIPLASLAGILMVTAFRMVERHNVAAVVRSTRSDALVFGLTATATIAFDLVVAIEIGIAVAAGLALRSVALAASAAPSAIPVEIGDEEEHDLLAGHIIAYRLDGALFFGAAQRFLTELTNVTDARVVILRMPDLQVLDATGAQVLAEIVDELERRHVTVLLKGIRPAHRQVLRAVGVLDGLERRHHVFDDLDSAVHHAHHHSAGRPSAALPSA